MSAHVFRYVVEEAPSVGGTITLGHDDSHHLIRVVRRGEGDALELLDARGNLWPAEIVATRVPAVVRVVGEARSAPTPEPVVLHLGLLDWSRLDVLYGQLTEIGLSRLVLFRSERSGRIPGPDEWRRRVSRLERVGESATRQSGAAGHPTVGPLVSFGDVLADAEAGASYLVDPDAEISLSRALDHHGGRSAHLIVGPEAGFSPAEIDAARSAGVTVCGLGDRVMRTGTAAIVAVTATLLGLGRLEAGG